MGKITILGAAYAGETDVEKVEISTDNGKTWQPATFIGPNEPFAWRQWQYVYSLSTTGELYYFIPRHRSQRGKTTNASYLE